MDEQKLLNLKKEYQKITSTFIFDEIISQDKIDRLKNIILEYPDQYSSSFLYDLVIGNSEKTIEQLLEVFTVIGTKLPARSLDNFGLYETLHKICTIDKLMPAVNLILDRVEKTEINQERISYVFQKELIEKIIDKNFPTEIENISNTIKKYNLVFDESEFNIENIRYCLKYKNSNEIDSHIFSQQLYIYFKLLDAYNLIDKFKIKFKEDEKEFFEIREESKAEIQNIMEVTLEKIKLETIISNTNKNPNKIKI
jgi:hypothetical protein